VLDGCCPDSFDDGVRDEGPSGIVDEDVSDFGLESGEAGPDRIGALGPTRHYRETGRPRFVNLVRANDQDALANRGEVLESLQARAPHLSPIGHPCREFVAPKAPALPGGQ
jgi:hypothetical protein